ncbi:MAG: hypothetical protein E7Z66_03045 [Thermoplasmata archaeon]|nr:hypothetical protein [Thermoplasmata archaeon]
MAYGRDYGSRDRRPSKPKEFIKVTCDECGVECEVPFKPVQGKPVYCRDCFKKYAPPKNNRRSMF